MAKPIAAMVKLQVPAGQATPAPPVGTALGPHGVNIMEFVKQFNAKTAQAQGMVTPVEVTIYKDRTFTFITKTDRKSTRLNSSHVEISYAVFCLKKKKNAKK